MFALIIGTLAVSAFAGDTVGMPAPTEGAEGAFPQQKHFSPYAGRNFPMQVF